MNPKLPSYVLTAATFVVLTSTWVKKNPIFIDTLGRSEVFEWGCGILSSAFIAVGLLLALYGLATQTSKRAYFLGMHFWAIALLFYAPGLQFGEYVVFTKIYHMGELPSVLPKLVENAQTLDSEPKRELAAENAYKVYGTTIAYRQDNGGITYYKPTAQDIAFQQKFAETAATNQTLKEEIIGGQLKQLPFVIAVEMGTFFLTFFLGLFIVAYKKVRLDPNFQPRSI